MTVKWFDNLFGEKRQLFWIFDKELIRNESMEKEIKHQFEFYEKTYTPKSTTAHDVNKAILVKPENESQNSIFWYFVKNQ